MFKIITDNGSDLSPSFLSENDVGCMYLSTILEGKVIAGKDKFLSAEDFYRMLREGAKPSTSQINPSDAREYFEEHINEADEFLYVGISSGLSGTVGSVRAGVEEILEKYPGKKIEIVDALTASCGEGLLVYYAVLLRDQGKTLEETASQVLSDDDETIQDLLQELTFQEETISQIRSALFDTRKALRFLRKSINNRLTPQQFETIDNILQDIESLLPHTQFMFDKINFQLQTAMSYTNHKQNKIIKIFSVAAVVFMPPTWIASVYGMNFSVMPELDWRYGYPISIAMMILSASITYLFFKRRKWL